MIFKNSKNYDKVKTIALIMPLFITLFGAIGEIWEIPYTDKIVLTLTAINGFIGGLVKLSNARFNKLEEDTDTTEEDDLLIERDDE